MAILLNLQRNIRSVPPRRGKHIDVEFCDRDLDAGRGQIRDGGFFVRSRRSVEMQVCLVSNYGDRNAGRLQPLHNRDCALALGWSFEVVVVVIQLDLGVRFVGILKRLDDVVFSDNLHPKRLTESSVLIQRFVHDIPTVDFSFVAAHHCLYVVVKALEQGIAGERISLFILEYPAGRLRMPAEIVADDEHMILQRRTRHTYPPV